MRVSPESRMVGALGHQVDDLRGLGLAVAIDPSVALLEHHEGPRQVEVDQTVCTGSAG